MTSKDYGLRRGKTKTISQTLTLKMIGIAEKEGRHNMLKSLWNAYYCLDTVYTHGKRMYGNYCGHRYCTTCLGIRKAEIINTYYPVLKTWTDAHMVTLIVKAVAKHLLPEMIKKFFYALNRIIDKYEKRHSRGKGRKLLGVRSLECNFNPIRRTYNPHYHIIVPNKETGETLIAEWLRLWTLKTDPILWASRNAQDIRKIDNMEGALVEVIKYSTKVFTDPTKGKVKGSVKMYARALYNIIIGMKGHRLVGSFGFVLHKKDEVPYQSAVVTTDYQTWQHLPEYHDWQNTESELTLFGYTPDEILNELLNHHVDDIAE